MSTETTEKAPAQGKGRRKKLIGGGGLALVLLAAWYLLLGPGSGGGEAVAEEPVPGEVLQLEPITMNLADGRLLKIGLALQQVEGGHELSGAAALDEAISFLGRHTFAQLSVPAGREKAKEELTHLVEERYHHEVMDLMFTEFVMQ